MADWSALANAAAGAARDFARSLAQPAVIQRALLHDILAENAASAFGAAHGFSAIDSFARYCAAVPLRDHAGFAAEISRIAAGEDNVLTCAPVIACEETGGTGGAKLVPYTAAGLSGFRAAVLPWLGDLVARRPALTAGRAYVTISPATRMPRRTASGLAIGLGSDAAYLGDELGPALAGVLVGSELAAIADPGEWQLATLAALAAADDLSFISLWSPTFLLALLDALPARAEAVSALLEPPARRRLDRALAGDRLDCTALWPRLACISCWTDGASAGFARVLGERIPHAAIEGKGLLATEAAVTVPWGGTGMAVPALASALIEFHDAQGDPHLCDTLRAGETYRVAVTTRSGLYRYDLGDQVECTGWHGAAPLLRFVGRAGLTSDLVGEKLDDAFVSAALTELDGPAMLAAQADPPGYALLLEAPEARAAARVEAALARNPQYAHARRIGQLAPLRAVHCPQLSDRLAQAGIARGQRIGDLKPVALLPLGGAAEEWLVP